MTVEEVLGKGFQLLPPAAEGTGGVGWGAGPRNTRSTAGLQCCLNWSGKKKSEIRARGLRWYLRASSTPHQADTDPCPGGGLLVCSGCPPGFRPQALALTSSWVLLLLFLFLPFFGFECIYPFPQGVERLTLDIYLPASLYLLLLIHPLSFLSLSCPVRVGSNSLSLASLFLESRFPCCLSFLFDLPSVSLMIQELPESFLFFFPVS